VALPFFVQIVLEGPNPGVQGWAKRL